MQQELFWLADFGCRKNITPFEAPIYSPKGKRVGLITNDQAPGWSIQHFFNTQGTILEVSGSCFAVITRV